MLASWASSVLQGLLGSSLILTECGGVGFAKKKKGRPIRTGVVCCVFFGAHFPFISASVDHGRHRLVTECNIHVVMGDELDKLDAHKIALEWNQGGSQAYFDSWTCFSDGLFTLPSARY